MPLLSPLILVVDDEPVFREILSDVLVGMGYRVECAVDGQDALERVAVEVPDVVVSDLHMPRVSGTALVRRLRAGGHALPVVLVSCNDVSTNLAGVRFVRKPFDLDHITAAVEISLAGT